MPRCRFTLLFCVVSILCISLSIASSHVKMCAEIERQALLKLKDGFVHGREILTSWKGEDCCKWKGISCDNLTGHVTSLDLQYGFPYWGIEDKAYVDLPLQGKIDSSICKLQHLTSLRLGVNELKGNIPNCIGSSLGQLIELHLADNQLVSVVPPTLGNLSNMQTLDLGFNHLVANDLKWLFHLSNLRYLDLSTMNLSQAIDWLSSISQIPSLLELRLEYCGLRQVNPKFITPINSSTSLKTLYLSGNDLNSPTLAWVLNVSKDLRHLDLSYNSLKHGIPNGFGNMISLQYLDLSHNELEGSIPKSIQSLCKLMRLKLNNNKLSGQLDDYLRQLHCAQNSLEVLDVSDNLFNRGPLPNVSVFSLLWDLSLRNTNIIGLLPQSFGHLPRLTNLDLSFNQLSGSLPTFEVTKLSSLQLLDLSHNQLNGSVPYSIGQLSSLKDLYLSSNELSGVISEAHLSNLSKLVILDVAENLLSINLSSNWVPPFQLTALYASSCILGPKFPTWLKHQRQLKLLHISTSGISDLFPRWFWDLSSNLSYMNVSHNNLSGAMPNLLPSMKYILNVWDFSFNNLSGPLPTFPELSSLFLSNNMFSGSLSSFCQSSPLFLSYVDLSSNLLAGPLSDCWEKFQDLQVLNLAKNNFSGKVPSSLGTLRKLKSLHLNSNFFSGKIPSLTLCSNLTIIDIGDNNLQGTLPAWVGHDLHRLIVLRLRANKFQGNIPTSLCNLSFLQVLDLSKNNITGEIPQCFNHITALSNLEFQLRSLFFIPKIIMRGKYEIASFSVETTLAFKGANLAYGRNLGFLTSIDLSCNNLIGEIPETITKLVALAGLNLSGNNLKGLIPNNIGHMEML